MFEVRYEWHDPPTIMTAAQLLKTRRTRVEKCTPDITSRSLPAIQPHSRQSGHPRHLSPGSFTLQAPTTPISFFPTSPLPTPSLRTAIISFAATGAQPMTSPLDTEQVKTNSAAVARGRGLARDWCASMAASAQRTRAHICSSFPEA